MKTKAMKRAEAVKRQAKHEELSTIEKLEKTKKRPGESVRERKRIIGKLWDEAAPSE